MGMYVYMCDCVQFYMCVRVCAFLYPNMCACLRVVIVRVGIKREISPELQNRK